MKYFTPDLLARFGSTDDAIADAASAEWEGAHKAYRDHLKELGKRFPLGVRSLLRHYHLHDAKVLTMAFDDRPYFSIFLDINNPSDPRKRFVELGYRLVRPPRFVRHQALPNDGTPLRWWLYDEFDVTRGESLVFSHSILFTGGYELQLAFTGLTRSRLRWGLFSPTNLDTEEFIGELEALSS